MEAAPASLVIVVLVSNCGGKAAVDTLGGGGSETTGGHTTGTGAPAKGTGKVGSPCASTVDCAGVETCTTQVPGGYCTVVIAECPAPGGGPGVCPAGSTCVNAVMFGGEEADYCLAECASAADCRAPEGYVCCPWNASGYCAPGSVCP